MEELIFQISAYSYDRYALALIGAGVLFFIMSRGSMIHKKIERVENPKKKVSATLPEISEREFEKKIRLYILSKYQIYINPLDGETQTSREIREKIQDDKIISIYESVESSIYQSNPLHLGEREKIIKILKVI